MQTMSRFFWVSSILAVSTLSLGAASVTITPSADTALFERTPTGNLGATASIPAGTTAASTRSRALMKFDLSGRVPSNATINSVRVILTVVKQPLAPQPSSFRLFRMAQSWVEGTKADIIGGAATAGEPTWEHRASPSTAWSAPGAAAPADFVLVASGSMQVAGPGSYSMASTSGLVADVQAWLQNPATNYGWILISQSESTPSTARRFGAREDTANSPRLEIDFTVPSLAAPTITQQPTSRTILVGGSTSINVTATGTAPLNYQWQLNGANLTGVTNPILMFVNAQPSNAGNYSVIVSNQSGVTNSAVATLTVIGRPSISSISRVGTAFQLQFTAQAGAVYLAQSRPALSTGAWSSFTNITVSGNQLVTVLDPASTATKFYRLTVDVAP